MNNKVIKVAVIIISIIIVIILGIIGYQCNSYNSFFSFNLMDLLTFAIASILIYFITEIRNDKRNKNGKIENVIIEINAKISTISLEIPTEKKQKEYLYIFKYISNKFFVLEKLVSKKDKENLNNAKIEFDKMREFINDNISQPKSYFEERREKIPNFASNIESNLDKIIVNIYIK